VCAVVESIDACHAHADRLQRVSDTTAQPVMEADRLFEAADTFVDMRGDIRAFDVRVIRCMEEVAPAVRKGVRYMAGDYAVCEVAVDVCLSDVESDKVLLAWRVVSMETEDFVQPRIGELLTVFPDWQGRALDGARIVTHSYVGEASCAR
jgi:hypothetical protein